MEQIIAPPTGDWGLGIGDWGSQVLGDRCRGQVIGVGGSRPGSFDPRSRDYPRLSPQLVEKSRYCEGTNYELLFDMPIEIVSYRDLEVWQLSMDLADLVYDMTEKFPTRERYGLALQMRKAAVSIPSNIAEGSRHRTAGYLSRVIIALGEHAELETQDILAVRRRFVPDVMNQKFVALAGSVGRLAHGLQRSLEARLDDQKQQRR